ncbi:MAG: protein tyrosine phosphatase family protein [Betaproteobacteria bacterium]
MRPNSRFLKYLVIVSTLACASVTTAATGDPANLVSWRAGLSSSGQPNAAYLKRVKSLGVDVVINLAPPEYDEAVPNEGAILAEQGVMYVNIPVRFGNPTAEDFRLFSDILKSTARKNVLVHCQINLRGSSFSFLHRIINESANEDEARSKLTGVWIPNPTWKKLIENILASAGKKVEIN